MSIHWGEERSQGGVAKTGVRGLSGVGMVGIMAGASLCRGGESRLGDTLILPRIRAHREASDNSKLCATNHLKAGRSLNGVPNALAPRRPAVNSGPTRGRPRPVNQGFSRAN